MKVWSGCLEHSRGLLPQEFHHLLSSSPPESIGKLVGLSRNMTLSNFESRARAIKQIPILFVDDTCVLEGQLSGLVKKELTSATERGSKCWALTI